MRVAIDRATLDSTASQHDRSEAHRDEVLREALAGLLKPEGEQKSLPAWLFYDERGSNLFEQITTLPEYYLTRTERSLLATHADEILAQLPAPVTLVELGAGTAAKTGLLLRAALDRQPEVLYQPIDVSASALREASETIGAEIPGVLVAPRVANYITEGFTIERPKRPAKSRVLALYIGSSIGNFPPAEEVAILCKLRAQLEPGDALLLGVDMTPVPNPVNGITSGHAGKSVATLLAAYDDAAGVTAAFNRNILSHLNRELGSDFDPVCFQHSARWNAAQSRIEMHLESCGAQTAHIGGYTIPFAAGETIHTENSYKFTAESLLTLLARSGYTPALTLEDPAGFYCVTLALAE
jgi:dimethylhistidine N-methyltransferase